MPRIFFPFAWGAPSIDTVIVPPAPPPFWSKDAPSVVAWQADTVGILPRFEHLYPEEATIVWAKKESV